MEVTEQEAVLSAMVPMYATSILMLLFGIII